MALLQQGRMPLLQLILSVAILLVVVLLTANIATTATGQAMPDCPAMCGEYPITYPFGIGERCYLRPEFNVSCSDNSTGSIWTNYNSNFSTIHFLEIYVGESEVKSNPYVAGQCFDGNGISNTTNLDLVLPAPFTVSDTKNNFTLLGCDYLAVFLGQRTRFGSNSTCNTTDSTCNTTGIASTFCTDYLGTDLAAGPCDGFGCSQIPIPSGLRSFQVQLSSQNDNRSLENHWYDKYRCSYGYIAVKSEFDFKPAYIVDGFYSANAILNWEIEGQSCDEARIRNTSVCTEHTRCENRTISDRWNKFNSTITGYICKCADGYEGNPYFPGGCKDVDECKNSSSNTCGNGTCHNLEGSYRCKCNSGFRNLNPQSCIPGTNTYALKVSLGVSLGFFGLLVVIFWIFCVVKRRKARKMRERFYKKNGGLLIEQQLASYNGSVDEAAIFSEKDIKTFTNNYAEKLGEGGFGIVYKGTLPGNNLPEHKKVVAVKMSKLNAPVANSAEFANEVILLSQVKHKNVLKLRGCCLERKTPILVFEYISQGTLYDHLHKIDGKGPLSWDLRLKIATGTAKALSYLHHSLANPIIHRDVKSMNILLDKNYEAKVSDFGASRLMDENENQVATAVQGTFGYLDPEYTELGILTKKSDVYSFGVVLAELLTSQEARKIAVFFVRAVTEKRLHEILDPEITKAQHYFPTTVEKVADLAKRCLAAISNERPTMDKVAMELGDILVEVTGKEADEGGLDLKGSEKDTDRLLGSPANYIVDVTDYGGPVIMATSLDYHQSMQNANGKA